MRKNRPFSHRREQLEEGGINLTPLIDVVFVVLIMFILVAPMLELDHVELAGAAPHPHKEMAIIQESNPLTIHVHQDNTIWFNSKKVTESELIALLKEARKKNAHRIPQVYHDKKAQFGTYQTVKNAVERAGFEQMDLILQPG